ncbi:MAG: gliding motility-associated C-terminal domain-containing protein, partial [Bacteroidota bacterium]
TAITVSPIANTSYTVTATALGCTGSASVAVTVNNNPAPAITGATAICAGSSTTLTATTGGAYSWNTGASTATITVSPTVNTTYTVTVANAGCTGSASVAVTVAANLVATITGTTTICNGASTTLSTSGGSTYSWNNGSTTSSITVNPVNTSTYSVTVSNGLCIGTASKVVVVDQNPNPVITGDTTICSGENTTLTANSGGTYSWNTGSTAAVITVSPNVNSNYTVIVNTNGCSGSASIQITVNPTPVPLITGITSICSGQSTILSSGPSGLYSWNTGETTNNITVTPTSMRTYSVSITINGCTGTAATTVTVTPPVIATITGNNICAGDQLILIAGGGTNYLWNTGATTATINDNPSTTNTYNVIVSTGNCKDTATYTVTVNPLPTITISADTTIGYGKSAPLYASGGIMYQWTPATGLNCSNCANPTATPKATTQYCVIVKDSSGCINKSCVIINVELKCGFEGELFVPNGFSPNEDGQNDILYVRGQGIVTMYWAIYDRWGEKVFETTDPAQGWDGTYKGKALDPAVFIYYLKVTCITGNELSQQGNVAIIR